MSDGMHEPGSLVRVRWGPHEGRLARVEWCRRWDDPYAPDYRLCAYRSEDGNSTGTVRPIDLEPVEEEIRA